jgi:prepilin peptidase CpaA
MERRGESIRFLACFALSFLGFQMTVYATNIAYASAALFCATVAAACDLKTRRIPNLLTGPSILFGLLLHLALGGWSQLGWSAAAALIGGGIFLVFYLAGGMGAGDVKLMAAVASLAGYSSVPTLLIATVLSGGVLALGLATLRGRLKATLRNIVVLVLHHRAEGLTPHPDLNLQNNNTLRLPYAIAIAVGCLVTFASSIPLR